MSSTKQSIQTDTPAAVGVAVKDSVADSLAAKSSHTPFRFQDTDQDSSVSANADTSAIVLPLEGPGLFKGHSLKPIHQSAEPLNGFVSDWFTLSLIFIVGVFTWFRFFYYRIFKQLVSACFNITATNQIVRDESVLLQRASLIISIIAYLLAGLFLYQASMQFDWNIAWLPKGLVRFAMFSVAVATAYSVKMIALRFMSAVFDQERPAALYIFNVFLMVLMAALVLLPANIIIAYADPGIRTWTIRITTGLLALLFVYRLVRATGIWTGIPGFSLFYLFLYLCTFEIAPLLIIWKFATL
jgi:hypothetical protein